MQVNGCASIALENERHSGKGAPVVAISLSLRSRNEIDELLFAVHVELPIDIAPVGDGRSFRYYQFFLNAREGVALSCRGGAPSLPLRSAWRSPQMAGIAYVVPAIRLRWGFL